MAIVERVTPGRPEWYDEIGSYVRRFAFRFRLGAFMRHLTRRGSYQTPDPSESDWIIIDWPRNPSNFVAVCRSPKRV